MFKVLQNDNNNIINNIVIKAQCIFHLNFQCLRKQDDEKLKQLIDMF